MESNWRWNVWALALSGLPVTLCARDPRYPDQWLTNWYNTGIGGFYYVSDSGGVQGYTPSGLYRLASPSDHFPYGAPVLPD